MLKRPLASESSSAAVVETVRAQEPPPETVVPPTVHGETVPRQHRSLLVSACFHEALEANQDTPDRFGSQQRDPLSGRGTAQCPELVFVDAVSACWVEANPVGRSMSILFLMSVIVEMQPKSGDKSMDLDWVVKFDGRQTAKKQEFNLTTYLPEFRTGSLV